MEFRYAYLHDSLNILMTFRFRVCTGVGFRVWGVGCGVRSFGKGLNKTYRMGVCVHIRKYDMTVNIVDV